MPPAKSTRNPDDTHKADAAGSKDKNGSHHASTKMRRVTSQTGNAASRDAKTNSAPTSVPHSLAASADTAAPTLPWPSFDREILHTYRRQHHLDTPTSFVSPFHQMILSQPGGIGIYSPTMMRKRQARRQSKDKLAMAVRKHFNARGVQENDVIVDLLFKVRNERATRAKGPNSQVIIAAE